MLRLSSRIVDVVRTPVVAGKGAASDVERFLGGLFPTPGKIFLLTDSNTKQKCLPVLLQHCASLSKAILLEIDPGEASKSLATFEMVFRLLVTAGAGRDSLLVNLGGGVVSDLGGYIAATYMRGIRYINIPTSLIGQADAAIGGKTAIDFGNLKNMAGLFYMPIAVFIDPVFLQTLPADHLRSGMAEIVKTMLLTNERMWNKLSGAGGLNISALPPDAPLLHTLLLETIKAKNNIVTRDFREKKLRKTLNFGHTLGHAFESMALERNHPIHHGDAVAAGMSCAAWLSEMKTGLSAEKRELICRFMSQGFPAPVDYKDHTDRIFSILDHDKKNKNGSYRFTLLTNPGKPVVNVVCSRSEIASALEKSVG